MPKALWTPSLKSISQTNLYSYSQSKGFNDYFELYQWSIDNPDFFWKDVWDICKIQGDLHNTNIIENPDDIEKAVFFKKATLNFTENLLSQNTDDDAIIFCCENGYKKKISYKDLHEQTIKMILYFKEIGVKSGDCVAGYMPNIPETIIAMLATAALGAIWTACSPDFGVQSVLDRLSQVNPKVLIIADQYFYNGKEYKYINHLEEILSHLPSVEKTIVTPFIEDTDIDTPHQKWTDILKDYEADEFTFEQFPFNHPLYILYSSGTTGIPKCIIHGAGGTLLEHKKEHYFHADVKKGDVIFYFTTCSWMMWHWLVSALSLKATIVLYDGAPTYPKIGHLFDLAEELKIKFFGASAKYLSVLQNDGYTTKDLNLEHLKIIGSTGSALAPNTFSYVYRSIKKDVNLASLAGGTDIIGCFAFGCPILPVYPGELQAPTLGLAIDVVNFKGDTIRGEKGELICRKPFPSRPIGFFNDPNYVKYHKAYYAHFNNIWYHGDFVEWTKNNGLIFHGRSDTTLNPSGVRIGTAEIYRQVEKVDAVLESLAVGQKWMDDERIILFVVLRPLIILDENLVALIKKTIRDNTTVRHLPAKIIQVPDLPRTKNGKITEIAVRHVIHGEDVLNKSVLQDPFILEHFKNLKELQHD